MYPYAPVCKICMCIHVYAYISTYIYIYVYIYTQIRTFLYLPTESPPDPSTALPTSMAIGALKLPKPRSALGWSYQVESLGFRGLRFRGTCMRGRVGAGGVGGCGSGSKWLYQVLRYKDVSKRCSYSDDSGPNTRRRRLSRTHCCHSSRCCGGSGGSCGGGGCRSGSRASGPTRWQ